VGEELKPVTASVTASITYTQNILGRKTITTLSLQAQQNGTISFLRDGNESLRIHVPNIAASISLLSNSSHLAVQMTSGSSFLTQYWKLKGNNFKLTMCWSFPAAQTISIPVRGVRSLSNATFKVDNGINFDWSDAKANGYVPTLVGKEVRVALGSQGCLDPIVEPIVAGNIAQVCRNCVIYDGANQQWYVQYQNVLECSKTGSSWTGNPTSLEDAGSKQENFYNGTHILHVGTDGIGYLTYVWRAVTPTANCGTPTLTQKRTVDSRSEGNSLFSSITQNSSGTIFIGYGFGSTVYLAYSLDKGSGVSWKKNISTFTNAEQVQVLNYTSGKILACAITSNTIYARIFYSTGNQTFGSTVTVATDARPGQLPTGAILNYQCAVGNNGIAWAVWKTTSDQIKMRRYDGTNWGSEIVVVSGDANTISWGITKLSGSNKLYLFRIQDQTSTLQWNSTDSTGTTFLSAGSGTFTNTTKSTYSIGLTVRPNATNFVGFVYDRQEGTTRSVIFETQALVGASPNTPLATSTDWEREPHVVASPITNTLVTSYIFNDGSPGHISSCAVRRSADGGSTWGSHTPLGAWVDNVNQNHTIVTVDSNGVFWAICSQSKNSTYANSYILVKKGQQDATDWTSLSAIASATDPIVVDKPWIVADILSTSSLKNNVYGCWSRYNSTHSEILFRKIAPTSSPEKVVYRVPRTTSTVLLTGCNMAIGPQGEVYVSWLHLLTSTDASIEFRWNELGETDWGWGRVHNVTSLKRFPTTGCPSNLRGLGCLTGNGGMKFNVANDPSIAVDVLGGIHVVFANYSSSSGGDIKYLNSGDCKRDSLVDICAWTSPVTINRDNTTKDQWEPAIHVSNVTGAGNPRGRIHVTVLDRRDDSSNIKWKVYDFYCLPSDLTTCTNTSNWTNLVISELQLDNGGKSYIGEYHGITNTSTKDMYTAWTDSRNFPSNGFDIYADWLFK